ncbi:hypothetical protein DWX93_11440 [Roseburia hominis]|uniref:Uncharacterized protein n=1 Tax=Roseburia hominis TaxID=301301 RepID=A0A395V7X0_9FIRM|nr:hypothetical protein DWX93_11440 [Roseburia hominis]
MGFLRFVAFHSVYHILPKKNRLSFLYNAYIIRKEFGRQGGISGIYPLFYTESAKEGIEKG